MDLVLLIGINVLLTGVTLWLAWQMYNKKSTGGGVDFDAAHFGSVLEKIIMQNSQATKEGIVEKVNEAHRSQGETLLRNKEEMNQKLGEFKGIMEKSMIEELGKIQQLQTQTLHQNKSGFENYATEAQKNLSEIKIANLKSLTELKNDVAKQLKESIDALNANNKAKLDEIQGNIDKRMNESLEKNLQSFAVVKENLGQMQSTAKQMIESSKSIDKLNNVFASAASKSTGNFAESYLESLLKEQLNVRHWQKQVQVPNGSGAIDFVISLGNPTDQHNFKKIGIDSKFPLTSYQKFLDAPLEQKEAERKQFLRGVRNMGKELHGKYFKPGFIDVLLMYLPSDSMYNEVVNDLETAEYLQRHSVTPVSPTTIFPLILVVKNYEAKIVISERAEEIVAGLTQVARNVDSFREKFRVLGDKLRHAQNNYDAADKSLGKMTENVAKLHRQEDEYVEEANFELTQDINPTIESPKDFKNENPHV